MPNSPNETSKLGKRGTFVIPAKLRQHFGLKEGSLVIAEATDEGILLRPAIALPTRVLTQEQVDTLLLPLQSRRPPLDTRLILRRSVEQFASLLQRSFPQFQQFLLS
jgi:AbrB family looped-hinge helix DNA binding protein